MNCCNWKGILDHDNNTCVTTQELNTLMADTFAARLEQAKVAKNNILMLLYNVVILYHYTILHPL